MKKLGFSILVMIALVLTSFAGCSSSEKVTEAEKDGIILSSIDMDNGQAATPGIAPYPMDEGEWADEEMYYGAESGGDMKYDTDSSYSIAGSSVTLAAEVPAGTERMIVRSGNISLVVEDVTAVIEQIKQYSDTFGGYVVSSSVWKNGDKLAGSVNFRVLSENFDAALSSLRDLAVEVTYENTSAQDVTEEYVDLDATLKNLEATEQQFLAILDQAETVEDILEVQKELSSVRRQIETTKARMLYLEQTSSTSIIYVQLEQSTMYFEYSADKRSGAKEGEKIQFTVSQISGGFAPYSYLWDFGDGETSTDENPVHAYSDDGYFSVSLTVTDDKGNTETRIRESYLYIQPGWSAGNIVGKAWDGLASFGRGLVNVLIWIGIFSPVWLIGGGLIFWLVRRKKNKKAS